MGRKGEIIDSVNCPVWYIFSYKLSLKSFEVDLLEEECACIQNRGLNCWCREQWAPIPISYEQYDSKAEQC